MNPRLLLFVEERMGQFPLLPPGLTSFEEALAPKGWTKKDWKPVASGVLLLLGSTAGEVFPKRLFLWH